MAPQETAKLDEILEALNEHRADFRVLKTELLGGDEADKPTGRIPRLEAVSRNHEKRIARIERVLIAVAGAILMLKGLSIGAESISQIIEVFHR